MAHCNGFPPERVVYNNPSISTSLEAETQFVIDKILNKGGSVVVDSTQLFRSLHSSLASSSSPVRGKVFLRLNFATSSSLSTPTTSTLTPTSTSTSSRLLSRLQAVTSISKFGVSIEDVLPLLQQCPQRQDQRFPFCGLQFHIGTMIDNPELMVTALQKAHSLADSINQGDSGYTITEFNIGGGLGVPVHQPLHRFPSILEFAAVMTPHMSSYRASRPTVDIRYVVEPGASLVGNTIGLLMSVTNIKNIPESSKSRWGFSNVGIELLDFVANSRLNQQPIIFNLRTKKMLPIEGNDVLVGPLCTGADVLLKTTDLSDVSVGDSLLVCNCGAYTFATSSHFNGRRTPRLMILDNTANHNADVGRSTIRRKKELFTSDQVYTAFDPFRWEGNNKVSGQPPYESDSELIDCSQLQSELSSNFSIDVLSVHKRVCRTASAERFLIKVGMNEKVLKWSSSIVEVVAKSLSLSRRADVTGVEVVSHSWMHVKSHNDVDDALDLILGPSFDVEQEGFIVWYQGFRKNGSLIMQKVV
eukprot:TRINITY_DN7650_c0_g1_i6.p1 TRINITY_DN7650_c0_g1~~TRINITY_DN7650_c0_g1_i6.p1  ORF type:complete len:529 (-),score=106.28 TRINITY_DN7650_c0_g1_i6:503-2089(-)